MLRDYSVGFLTELDIALISVDSEKDSVLNYVFGFSWKTDKWKLEGAITQWRHMNMYAAKKYDF